MKHSIGLLIGRFQPLHLGHTRVITTMLEDCDQLVVAIGSTQESGTEKNPFDYPTRKKMLRNAFKNGNCNLWDRIKVFGLPDIFNEKKWVEYVLTAVNDKFNATPDVYYCGSYYDGHWFEESGLPTKIVNRTDKDHQYISSSMIRNMCMYQDERWKEFVHEDNWSIVQKLQDSYSWGEKI